jgi:hypothetical protein
VRLGIGRGQPFLADDHRRNDELDRRDQHHRSELDFEHERGDRRFVIWTGGIGAKQHGVRRLEQRRSGRRRRWFNGRGRLGD